MTPDPNVSWREQYTGGCPFAEAEQIKNFMQDVHEIQERLRRKSGTPVAARAFHAKSHVGVENAEFVVDGTLEENLHGGFFRPGAKYRAIIRLSSAAGVVQDDEKKDLRGIAIRLLDVEQSTPDESATTPTAPGATGDSDASIPTQKPLTKAQKEVSIQDLLLTNAPASHARNARQFMLIAKAGAGNKLTLLPKLIWHLGFAESLRMLTTVRRQSARRVASLATERYWSRAPFALGPTAIKLILAPHETTSAASPFSGPSYLRDEFVTRLKQGPVIYRLMAQMWVNEAVTPIEDGVVEWTESISPAISLGTLTIPQQDLNTSAAEQIRAEIDRLQFNPWTVIDSLRPLGSLNRARRLVYRFSAGLRAQRQRANYEGLLLRIFTWLMVEFFAMLNKFVPWHKLPRYFGALNLVALRGTLRERNLHDTDDQVAPVEIAENPIEPHKIKARWSDGSNNDLTFPQMGCANARFGRNAPREMTRPNLELLNTPSPREISRHLLARKEFIPATTLNLLAAGWIQFQVHDWFAHKSGDKADSITIPLEPDDDWDKGTMRIPRTPDARTDREKAEGLPPVYENKGSHWWDGSQIYGSDDETQKRVRTGTMGMLKLNDREYRLEIDPVTKRPITGVIDNWWLGLGIFHSLFALEHNAVCRRLHLDNPYWSDDEIFNTARLVITALMAKIHTVEWTPAILAHPTIDVALNANWWGLVTERFQKVFGRPSGGESIAGIPMSGVDHHGVPFSLTEEFVAVYRMHPLIPDTVPIRSSKTGDLKKVWKIQDLALQNSESIFEQNAATMADVIYSFGVTHPGAITLENYPDFLRKLVLDDKATTEAMDLAAIDILRDRERGVPRYNEFRRMLRRGTVSSFDEVTGNNSDVSAKLRETYGTDKDGNDRVDLLDTMVGMYAEPVPKGFGFSDTAFRIFILMASRRLKSDRFIADDFTEEVYTPAGLAWVQENGMQSIILRHFPMLAPALRGNTNPFAPWRDVARV